MSEGVKLHTKYTNKAGIVVPSVTTIIGNNLGWNKNVLIGWARKMAMQGIDPYKVRDQAGSIGTLAHKLVEYHLLKKEVDFLSEYSKDDQELAQNAFEAFLEWEDSVDLKPVEMEERLVSEWHQFGGTIDLQAYVNGKFSLVDFKTSNGIYPDHVIQLSAYEKLMTEAGNAPETKYILHLHKERGDFKPLPYYDLEEYWEVFLHCLGLDYYREKLSN